MAQKENFLFDVVMPKIYGIGAAVVIVGALFKIEHWPGADIAIIAGLGTEALIFFLSAFQPQHKEPDWALVYPQLSEGYDPSTDSNSFATTTDNSSKGLTRKLDDMLKDANVTPDAIKSLGEGLNHFAADDAGRCYQRYRRVYAARTFGRSVAGQHQYRLQADC